MTDLVKILVVDDLPEKRLVYRSILEELGEGVQLVMAGSAVEALKLLLQNDFAVILLDVNMPEMDGFEAAAMIRSRRRCAHTPIIFITAYVDDLHVMKGYAYGAVDYILSPVHPDVLRSKVKVFVELFRQKAQLEVEREKLAALNTQLSTFNATLFDQAAVGIVLVDLHGRIVEANDRMAQIVGRDAPGLCQMNCQALMHPDDWLGNWRMMQDVVSRTRPEFAIENRYQRGDGEWVWVNATVSPLIDEKGNVHRLMAVIEDISERKRVEAELGRHRERLEALVRERTRELEATYERLQLAGRLASIGTLAAGLGHDLGNLLLPVRARLDSLERTIGASPPSTADHAEAPSAIEDIKTIRTACDYLGRLSQGLRLFALDPEKSEPDACTDLGKWWPNVESFLRNSLPRTVVLEHCFHAGLPPVAIAPHAFTQVIYNLVQNAGDALRERGKGNVTLSAAWPDAVNQAARTSSRMVVIRVADDGPGMSDEVKQRCMEPFFTTKTRQISTGLGLALVHGAVHNAGGSITIESKLDCGTTFELKLPVAQPPSHQGRRRSGPACVNLQDARMRAYVTSLLESYGVEVSNQAWSPGSAAQIVILENPNGCWPQLEAFLQEDPNRRAIVFDASEEQSASRACQGQVAVLHHKPAPIDIRNALNASLRIGQ